MKTVTLPSSRKIEITLAPFPDAVKLYQACAAGMLSVDLKGTGDTAAWCLQKDLFCLALCSPAIDSATWECLKRCTYEGQKITKDSFEAAEAREDFLDIAFEVAKENLAPFMKTLFAQFKAMSEALDPLPKSSA